MPPVSRPMLQPRNCTRSIVPAPRFVSAAVIVSSFSLAPPIRTVPSRPPWEMIASSPMFLCFSSSAFRAAIDPTLTTLPPTAAASSWSIGSVVRIRVRFTLAAPGSPSRFPPRRSTSSSSAFASGPSGPGFSGVWQGTRKFAPLIARSLRSIVEVAGPTMPSGLRRWARWNTRTAVSVPPPNFPSGSNCGVAPSALRSIWVARTCSPDDPRASIPSPGARCSSTRRPTAALPAARCRRSNGCARRGDAGPAGRGAVRRVVRARPEGGHGQTRSEVA